MRAAAVRADLDGDADADALVNPVPGIAAVFRITSTILSLAEAVAHDRRRIKRMAARIQKLALTLNTLAHDSHGSALATEGGLYLQASPLDDTASGKSPSKRASVLFGLGTGPGSVSAKNKAVPSHLSTAIPGPPPSVVAWMRHSPSSDSIDSFRSFNSRPTSPVSPTGTPTQGTERSSSRAWRAVSRLSMMALGSPTSPAPLLPGTIQLSSKRPLPPHLTIESLLSLLERIKGFIKNTATTDLVRILGTRQRFETRIKTYQGLLRTWVEECGDGIEDSEAWDLDDALDFVQDAESLKSLLITQLAKLTGDRSFSPLSSTHLMSSSPVPDDDESGAVTDDDDRDFNLLAELRIPSGLHAAAFHFAKRRLEELEARSRQDTELAAVFGSTHSVSEADGSGAAVSGAAGDSTDYSIHPGLEMKWLRLVLKALHACQMDENASSVSPYDLDEEGDGAPLGPVGLGESLKGVFYTRNLQTHTIDSQIVVIKKFRASKRDHSVLLKENISTWLYLDQAPTPHLLPLLGTNLTTRPSFLVCPYMKNGNLLAYTRAHPGHSLRLLLETSRGMAHLHATGVLHGALRASNVLVGDDGHALLADVGLAQYRGECATDGVARAGWRRWAAPEILRGGAMRPQSDTYSFAMMMYEILTGDIPFINRLHDPDDPEGGFDLEMEEAEVTRLVLHEAIRPLKPSHCPDKFWQLVEACWAQDALQRPTFANVEAQLQALLKLQSMFRRQSQIKSRAEAFVVELPLDDMMSSVLAVGGNEKSPALINKNLDLVSDQSSSVNVRSSFLSDSSMSSNRTVSSINGGGAASPGAEAKISLNLKFNLDSHPLLTTMPSIPLGIDLPPTSASTANGEEDEELLEGDASDDEWDTAFDDALREFWALLFPLASVDNYQEIPWVDFVRGMRSRYPTFAGGSNLALRAAFEGGTHGVTFERFKRYIVARVSTKEREDHGGDLVARVFDGLFGAYCAAVDADLFPRSAGPVSGERLRDLLVNGSGVGSLLSGPGTGILSFVACVPDAGALDVLEMLADPRVKLLREARDGGGAATFEELVNGSWDAKGWLPLHCICKMNGLGAGPVVDVLVSNGAQVGLRTRRGGWTPMHVASWVGGAAAVQIMLTSLPLTRNGAAVLEIKDDEGWTCLQHAARYGHVAVTQMIVAQLEASYEEDVVANKMREICTPALELARKYGFLEVEALLEACLSC